MFRAAFAIKPDAEVSLEIDPRIATPEQAVFLRQAGFNRISLGVQDFDRGTQKAIGRNQSREKTLKVYQGCRDAGFAGVNVDLVYGTVRLIRRDDTPVTDPLEQALITSDERLAYPVRDGIPILLEEQGILIAQLDEA